MNGIPAISTTMIVFLAMASTAAAAPSSRCAAAAAFAGRSWQAEQEVAQDPQPDLEVLRARLAEPGPEGRETRAAAVVGLLAMPSVPAHQLLQEHLLREPDPDGLRAVIFAALQQHLLAAPAQQFGAAETPARHQILAGYLLASAPLWRARVTAVGEGDPSELQKLARQALQRVPVRELELVARSLLAPGSEQPKCELMRCLGDLQQTLLAPVLAEQLEADDPALRVCATEALQWLCYPDAPLRSKAEFEQWQQRFGSLRYVDLVERAARSGPRPLDGADAELSQLRVALTRDVVRALVVRAPGIDWSAVQARTVVDDPAVLVACLEQLQQTLGNGLSGEDAAAPRQSLCRALLQRFRSLPVDQLRTRALLLEVAAYLARVEETELATEVGALLVAQLELADVDSQLAALRGLRRFPSPEMRALLVQFALAQLPHAAERRQLLAAVLTTLSSRTPPRWSAPLAADADKPAWLQLVDACCHADPGLELRDPALVLAQTLDAKDARVEEVFPLLLDLVRDPALDTKFRSTTLILLQGWRNEKNLAERWVTAMQDLLADSKAQIRQQAAESLGQLTESSAERRSDWIQNAIAAVRERLEVETDAAVLRNLVDCMQAFGRQPQMQSRAIGALKKVIGDIPVPVPAEQQFRLEPMLQALATIAADARAELGQWTAACASLQVHRKRQSLRLVLQSHGAVDLAKEVASSDESLATGARQAMQLLIETALLKPPREPWTGSEELLREAREVRTAFGALDSQTETWKDSAAIRLLRLEVDLAAGKPQEVVLRATQWLAATGPAAAGLTDADRARMRVLAAEAQLALGRPDAARRLLDEPGRGTEVDPALLDLQSRIGRALVATDLAGAVGLFERVLDATAVEDPAFRSRLLDWMQNSLRLRPDSRPAVLQRANLHATLFAAPECPTEQRDAFEQMRTTR